MPKGKEKRRREGKTNDKVGRQNSKRNKQRNGKNNMRRNHTNKIKGRNSERSEWKCEDINTNRKNSQQKCLKANTAKKIQICARYLILEKHLQFKHPLVPNIPRLYYIFIPSLVQARLVSRSKNPESENFSQQKSKISSKKLEVLFL